jgi:hypothetical protein
VNALSRVWRFVRGAPLTYLWLSVLLATTVIQHSRSWTPYLTLFTLFLAPAEHWLGQRRWLTVGLTAHIAAT